MKKFLVTGGAGFIGSHIVEELVSLGARVRVLDNFFSGKKENLRPFTGKIELLRGDIRSSATCLKACRGIDFVLHQAALRSVPKSLKSPGEYNQVNIEGTLNMLEAARKARVRSFVFASSSSIYGEALSFPQKESDSPRLISPYALTKLAGEYYCRIFSTQFGLPTVSLRYFNVFGPRQALDDEYAVVIPKFITCILNAEHPPIYGSGRQSRDFTFVKNVVSANIAAIRRGNLKGEVFNIATGRPYTILELVRILNRLIGKDIKPVFLKPRLGDVFKTHADLANSKKLLKFSPQTGFIEGLRQTIGYFKGE